MTISTAQPELLCRIFVDALGWELMAGHTVGLALERQWGIAPGSAGERGWVFRSSGASRGMVRVVAGVERLRTRPMATRWAGVEMIVSRDLDELHEVLARYPAFNSFLAPSTWDWTEYGSNIHRAFIGSVPGGTHLAFTMGMTRPVGRDFPTATAQVGHVFDVPLVTSEFPECKRFYCGTLGMVPFLQSEFRDHLWHRLWKLPPESPARLDIYKGNAPGTGLGGIELQGYESRIVDPEPAEAELFDGGACLLTYTTDDIEGAFAAIAADPAARLLSRPEPIAGAPYHGARMFAFQGPVGERMELIERAWTA
jgi:catechol 2,3-dioxygenase-like lactoylglutathione lyase family enzyme